ncbi:kinase-like protein [Polyporus arcularius HHB13444]|uniref:Kinase-like protein n=1 Tax=Polyporus arcularius HHB13444 TaxID=1314778 RepID=A0A5C3PQ69_9APHY|nr:kinase-like protein [Polyporus arcularius HHB13444]
MEDTASISSTSDSSDNGLAALIDSLDLDAMRILLVATRKECHTHLAPTDLSCTIVSPPQHGSYNLLYEARFSDGVSWALRIARYPWNELHERTMRLDIVGYQYISSHTSIPMPRIYAYNCGLDNVLHHPYVVTDFMRGTLLIDVWNDASWWIGERSKERLLASVAKHMVALAELEFDKIGCLDRNEADGSHHVVPFPCAFDEEEESGIPNTLNFGPFESAHAYYLALVRERGRYGIIGTDRLAVLRMLLATLPDDRFDGPPFHFGHPDFDSQNILIDDAGEVSGFLDWDGLCILPRQVAALTYPSWLTVDWDPGAYAGYKENPPYDTEADLHMYRQMYTGAIDAASGGRFTDITRNSHVVSSLFVAVNATYQCYDILDKVGTYVFGVEETVYKMYFGLQRSTWLALGPSDIAQFTESEQQPKPGGAEDGSDGDEESEGEGQTGSDGDSEYKTVGEEEIVESNV